MNEAAVSIRSEMVGTGVYRQADPNQGVHADKEMMEDNPSIRVEPFEALTENASQ